MVYYCHENGKMICAIIQGKEMGQQWSRTCKYRLRKSKECESLIQFEVVPDTVVLEMPNVKSFK